MNIIIMNIMVTIVIHFIFINFNNIIYFITTIIHFIIINFQNITIVINSFIFSINKYYHFINYHFDIFKLL